jgi:hypothetical protein
MARSSFFSFFGVSLKLRAYLNVLYTYDMNGFTKTFTDRNV